MSQPAKQFTIESTYTVTSLVHRCSGDEYDDYPSTMGIHATWRQRYDDEDRVWLPGYFKWDNGAKFCPQCGIELMTGPLPVKWNHDDNLPF